MGLEFGLGYMLIAIRSNVIVSLTGALVFGVFSVINIRSVSLGHESCNCFGRTLHFSPIAMLFVDLFATLCLLVDSRLTFKNGVNLLHQVRQIIPALGFSLLLMVSIRIFFATDGSGVLIDKITQGDIDESLVYFDCALANTNSEAVTVESAVTSCSCVSISRRLLPQIIPPNGTTSIRIVMARDESGKLRSNQYAQLYLKGKFLSRLRVPLEARKE